MKKLSLFLGFMAWVSLIQSQPFNLGWTGNTIFPEEIFMNASQWTCNQSDLSAGDSCSVTSDSAVHLHWYFGAGTRPKFAQCYKVLSEPVDLSNEDVFGIDIRGVSGKRWVRNVEFKFESGSTHAVYTWENLAHMNRWCERLVILKKQFSNYQAMDWSAVKVISIAVTMNSADASDNLSDSGTVSFRNLISRSVDSFIRAENPDSLTGFSVDELETIRLNAIEALKNRQKANGLLTTWTQDGSSWLYGQGLALKALTIEGNWTGSTPLDDYAQAAQNLARFLSSHQEAEGYWPRAWNSLTGNPIVMLEWDNTVWMGDFPWIPGSLAYYYRKSGDASILPALVKARSFLYSLIDKTGRVNTMNIATRQKSEVSNYEGYAAALFCLFELGDTIMAKTVMHYLMENGWDEQMRIWNEGPNTSRLVLLVNTWLAALVRSGGYPAEAMDALSLVGNLLYTTGSGGIKGFDGIGPISAWYEGTLSYIAAGGPGSNTLFAGIKEHIRADGTVAYYDENLGSMAGIWAVDWSSLDATSWLYFTAAGKSPFGYSGADPDVFTGIQEGLPDSPIPEIYWSNQEIHIRRSGPALAGEFQLSLYNLDGSLLGNARVKKDRMDIPLAEITREPLIVGRLYLLVLFENNHMVTRKLIYQE